MKALKNIHQIALFTVTLFIAFGVQANPILNHRISQLEFNLTPPKKKCRKCVKFRPDRIFKSKQLDGTFGIGVLPTFLMDDAKSKLLPVSLGLEYRFSEVFSLGLAAGHSVSESKSRLIADGIKANWTNSFYLVALRPAFHVTRVEDWDFYGGFSIGVNHSELSGSSNGTKADLHDYERHRGIGSNTNVAFSGFTGVRYVIDPKWTVGAELGFGVSIFTIGMNYLLNATNSN